MVSKGATCWRWTGLCERYGVFRFQGKLVKAHRYAWELAYGPIPEGLLVLHHCDNPACVKTEGDELWPDGHLFLGTQADNIADMDAKGRRHTSVGPRINYRGSLVPAAKLTDQEVLEIRAIGTSISLRALARQFKVGQTTVWGIIHRRTWKHLP